MSLDKIQQIVGSLAKSIDDNERIATPILAAKLNNALVSFPSDQTLGAMARVIGKMAENNTIFIRRAELKQLYNKLFTRNTKFAELFKDELGEVTPLPKATIMTHDDSSQVDPYEVGDQILANALQSVFDKHIPVKMYSQALADRAQKLVSSSLDSWNLAPTKLGISDGNDKFLIIQADYETPKGIVSIYVPVEVHDNKVSEASIFMGNSGPQELNHLSLKEYLTTASPKLVINGSTILQVLTNASSENREISGAELALTKLNATRQGKGDFFQNQIIGQKIAEAAKEDVRLPRLNEFESLEKKFTSSSGQAEFKFGSAVQTGSEHIARELKSYGHKNPQVSVYKTEDDTIFYSVALDGGRVGFTVPVKTVDGKIVRPTIILCKDKVSAFSQEGVNELYVNNYNDYKAAAVASPLHDLSAADLLNNIRKALTEDNLPAAEDALNVLSSKNGQSYITGLQIYMNGLAQKQAEELTQNKKEPSCSMVIASSVSEHPICGHTGLPVHKTYQDKDGNCRPLFRRQMDETYEGVLFNNAKIFG
jgi:hypothetical protein